MYQTEAQHQLKQLRARFKRRLTADMSLQTMLHEAVAIALTTGAMKLYPFVYDSSLTPEKGSLIITASLVCVFVALFTEFLFHSVSVHLQTRYLNVPVAKVWKAKWRLHLWVSASTTLMCIAFLLSHYLPIVRNNYVSEGVLSNNSTCSNPFS